MNGNYICAALQDQYIMVNTENSTAQDLFPYQSDRTNPLITLIKNVMKANSSNISSYL